MASGRMSLYSPVHSSVAFGDEGGVGGDIVDVRVSIMFCFNYVDSYCVVLDTD